ncbi:hypothetical protein [Thiocystis violacea]|uniref:hypothetical protein n=1 Tax=Thiocystis violacea TaxID=13725 RepID=UPI001906238C|nr:hypothetical protein [Thiocystis violacea]
MSLIAASFSRLRLAYGVAAAMLTLCCSLSLGADDPCADWILTLRPDREGSRALRFSLEYRAPPANHAWTFYGVVLPASVTRSVATLTMLSIPESSPLKRIALDGYAKPIYAVSDWYDPDAHWILYLIRLPTPERRLDDLGLNVLPDCPGRPSARMASKFHGALLPKVLAGIEMVVPQGMGEGALVCQVRSFGGY